MATDKREYRILVVEDNPGDFALVEDFLFEHIVEPQIVDAVTFKAAKQILLANTFDVILLDLSLPDRTGTELILDVIEISNNAPVIVFTGYIDFEFGVKSLSLGVSDYILKDDLTSMSLYKSVIYSIERKKSIAESLNYTKAIEGQNERLKEISWIQSHLVRAPLARIMGLIPLLTETKTTIEDVEEVLNFILNSANELDEIIKNITDKSCIEDFVNIRRHLDRTG